MIKRFHAIIVGKVQGIFFRATARERAKTLKLNGFVRNLPDGSLELDAQGEKSAIDAFLQWCHHGPPGARVDKVDLSWMTPDVCSGGFIIMS